MSDNIVHIIVVISHDVSVILLDPFHLVDTSRKIMTNLLYFFVYDL